MLTKSTNQTNRKEIRLQHYNYSQSGWYFVTICTKDKKDFFGEINNSKMFLNKQGEIIKNQWLWLATQYDYVQLDEYIVMPNHLHGVLIIENNDIDRLNINNAHADRSRPVPTERKVKSLSELIGAFKTTSSKIIHQNGLEHFAWQRSFYDHVIRDENSLNDIREYITHNPMKWDMERNNQGGSILLKIKDILKIAKTDRSR